MVGNRGGIKKKNRSKKFMVCAMTIRDGWRITKEKIEIEGENFCV